ncbi:MAG TPA: YncE family protein [Verrucomicrobiae bacterium]|nr:YncE family protein [Verrucomicrobiae bacterium]
MHPTRLSVRIAVLLALTLGLHSVNAQSYVNFEGKQTRPICLSPDGTRLFAVNTPDARLSVFDVSHPLNPFLIAEIPVGIEPVSVNALNNDEVWVVNEVSDSVSVVSVPNRLVVDTLYVKDEPADVVFADGKAFVSASRNNRVSVFDVTSRVLLTNIALFGENPRSLAVNTNGTKVFVAFALSGNRTTIIPASSNAPPQITNGTPPMKPGLPPPPQVGLIVDASDPAWTNSVVRYRMPDNDVAEIDVATLSVSRYFTNVGTVNFAVAVQPNSGHLYVANTDARNLTHFEPALNGFFVTNRISRVDITNGVRTHFDLNPGYHPTNFTLLNRTNALAQPTAIAFGPSGGNFYLAAFGSDRVARVNAVSGNVVSRIELCPTAPGSASDPRNKRGPRGIALKPGVALYVLNRISGTISIINPSADTLVREIPIGSHDPTPPAIRQGRGFLYDAKLSGNGTVSCASCHIDAEMDMLAWDLGDPQGNLETTRTVIPQLGLTNNSVFHPMKGPMTTQTLRGLSTLEPFHWRGDRTNFTHFNGAFASLLGGSALSVADMNAYRDFINTIRFEPNPNQNLDRTLPTSFAGANPRAGFTNFVFDNYVGTPQLGISCNACHALPTGSARFIVAAAALQESQDFKVPHLRNIYQKTSFNRGVNASSVGGFGFLHDGSFSSLFEFLSAPVFQNFANNATIKSNLQAFMLCFDTGMAPAVGYARTLVASNVNTASISNDWSLLESQANAITNLQLIVKGTINGQHRGLLYQTGLNNYRLDSTNSAPLTRAQLVDLIQEGDTLTIMGVPVGSGQRMGIDRDLDGILDFDEPRPQLQIARVSNQAVLNWPLSAVGYRLEQTTNLANSPWSDDTNAVEIVNQFNFVTNNSSDATKFFRLRRQ